MRVIAPKFCFLWNYAFLMSMGPIGREYAYILSVSQDPALLMRTQLISKSDTQLLAETCRVGNAPILTIAYYRQCWILRAPDS